MMSFIDEVRIRILDDQNRRNWEGYINMLKILKNVFVSPKYWVLEFLQNAEDAKASRFLIRIDHESLQVFNNGHPFDKNDIESICDVKSRKIPARGFKGYLGIGFKSIFRVSTQVEVHSGNFHFKFDRNHWKNAPGNWPWELLPVEVAPRALPDNFQTGFFVPVQNKEGGEVLGIIKTFLSINEFPTESLLTLQFIEEIVLDNTEDLITFSKSPPIKRDFKIGEKLVTEEVIALNSKTKYVSEAKKYRVYRTTVNPPIEVRTDEVTNIANRTDVTEREVGIIFPLDLKGHVEQYRGHLAGVYSFLPLQTEQTGLPLSIFGDFIPQPGRDLINYGASWNIWMCGEVLNLLKGVLKINNTADDGEQLLSYELLAGMKNQYAFGPGQKFWETYLLNPLKEFLQSEPVYRDSLQELVRLDEIVVIPEEITKTLGEDIVKATLRKLKKRRAHPAVEANANFVNIVPRLGEYDILQVFEEIGLILKSDPVKLSGLYKKIASLSDYYIHSREKSGQLLSDVRFVLGEDGNYHSASQVAVVGGDIPQLPSFLQGLLEVGGRAFLHHEIASDRDAVKQLERCGLKLVDRNVVIQQVKRIVEEISGTGRLPTGWNIAQVIKTTLWLVEKNDPPHLSRLIAQDGTFQEIGYLFFPGGSVEWSPLFEEGFLRGYLPLHTDYTVEPTLDLIRGWLQESGIHGLNPQQDSSLIQTAAEEIARINLSKPEVGHIIVNETDKDLKGYDLKCSGHCKKVFEVKGMIEPKDILLEPSEFRAAQERKEEGNYIVYAVYQLPKPDYKYKPFYPQDLMIPIERARIPVSKWLGSGKLQV